MSMTGAFGGGNTGTIIKLATTWTSPNMKRGKDLCNQVIAFKDRGILRLEGTITLESVVWLFVT